MSAPSSPPPDFQAAGSPWQLFLWTLTGSPGLLGGLFLALCCLLGFELAIPRLLAEAIDAALVQGDGERLDKIGLVILSLTAGLYVAHVLYLRTETSLLYRAMYRLRRLLYSRLLEQPLNYFAHTKGGELTHLIINDTEVLENHGVFVFSDVPFALVTVIAIVALMFWMDWHIAIVIVGFLVLATTISFRLGRPLPTLRKTIQKIGGQMSARLHEAVGGIRTVKAFGRTRHETHRLDELNAESARLETREGQLGALVEPLLELMELLGVVIIVWYGAHQVLDGAMTPGLLVAFIAYMELLSEPVANVGKHMRHIQVCRGVMQRLVDFLGGLATVGRHAGCAVPDAPPNVSFAAISYCYPGADVHAVSNVSFEAVPGQIVAIAGRNGAGKSTLMELLLGFREAEHGVVRVSGATFEEWDLKAWRDAIALVPQDVFLFNTTLAENIGYGKLEASRSDIERAATRTGLTPLIKKLPQGLDTMVGDRGQRLSGGERQRLAFARMLLRNPRVIVFDEPTSSLDGEATRDISALIRELGDGRVIFIIAHRSDAIQAANRVILMDNGGIVFDGTPGGAVNEPLYQSLFSSASTRGAITPLLAPSARDVVHRKSAGSGG